MNFKIISPNIQEALEALESIRDKLNSKSISETEFQIQLQHVYHHLNVAWNIRHKATDLYKNMTTGDFLTWRKYPSDLDFDE